MTSHAGTKKTTESRRDATGLAPIEERPLVTFVVFAYNQEQHIREAVESAFAQTYEPLEIILSDDCSTDRTFEIMQEMAAAYVGPHCIVTRKNQKNAGVWAHIATVVSETAGEFLVVAAGDDVSLPNRTAELVKLFKETGADLASSNYNSIDDCGLIIAENQKYDSSGDPLWQIIPSAPRSYVLGASAAYRRTLLRRAFEATANTSRDYKIFNEDVVLSAFGIAAGAKFASFTQSALVNYRLNNSSLSNFHTFGTGLARELTALRTEEFWSRARLAYLLAIQEIATHYPRLQSLVHYDVLHAAKRRAAIESMSYSSRLPDRFAALLSSRTQSELRIVLARLFGIRATAILRFLWNRLPSQKLC